MSFQVSAVDGEHVCVLLAYVTEQWGVYQVGQSRPCKERAVGADKGA